MSSFKTTSKLLEAEGLLPSAPGSKVDTLFKTGKATCKTCGTHAAWSIKRHSNHRQYRTAYCQPCKKRNSVKNYQENKERYKEREVIRKKRDPLLFRFIHQRSTRSGRDGIEWTVTINEVRNQFNKQNGKCIYTGLDLIKEDVSIDRIDSSKGYLVDNIQLVIPAVNFMKHSLSHDRFIQLCKLITENN